MPVHRAARVAEDDEPRLPRWRGSAGPGARARRPWRRRRRRLRRRSIRPRPRVGTSRRLFRRRQRRAPAARAAAPSPRDRARCTPRTASCGAWPRGCTRACPRRPRGPARSDGFDDGSGQAAEVLDVETPRRPRRRSRRSRSRADPRSAHSLVEELLEGLRVAPPDLKRDLQAAPHLVAIGHVDERERGDGVGLVREAGADAALAQGAGESGERAPRGPRPVILRSGSTRPGHEPGDLRSPAARRCRCDP